MMKVQELARLAGGKLQGDGEREIRGVAGLETAGPADLSFAVTARDLERSIRSRAGCVLLPESAFLPGQTSIAVSQPKLTFARLAALICPSEAPEPGIHPTAVISPDARLAAGVSAGQHVVVERGACVSEGTRLGAGVFIGAEAQIGAHCVLYPHVTIYPGAQIGDRVVLHAGVVIGGDGFGYVPDGERLQKFPQLGGVVIEDDVEIGCNTTVDRGSLGVTRIGAGTKIDNLVQIAHNVSIGRNCLIVAQTGISGSTTVGDNVVIGGQAGIGEHARIESRAQIGGQSGVLPGKIIRRGSIVWGTPARPLAEFQKLFAHLSRLPEMARKIKDLSGKGPR
ncbi:MAG: UDP-3-O-(3-hydroxymyristoyl)glucosamine N-acyltransferase [Terriglobia bacterium]